MAEVLLARVLLEQRLEVCYWKSLQEYVADVKHAYVVKKVLVRSPRMLEKMLLELGSCNYETEYAWQRCRAGKVRGWC